MRLLISRTPRALSISLVATWLSVAVLPGDADAGPVPFHGTLTLEFAGIGSVSLPGTGTLSIAPDGGSLASLSLPASAFDGSAITPINDLALFPVFGIQATLRNDPGAFSGAPLAGAMPLPGVAKICLYAFCGMTGSFSSNVANLSVPLDVVGLGGAAAHVADINVTVVGAPWTTATATVGTLTRMGFVQGAGGGSGTTASQGGRIQLVTPVFITTNLPALGQIALFGILDLHFVPEPGTIGLLGGGIAALACAGMGRR